MLTEQVALGLEPGVHVDPGSPAAKEYALPLNQARRTGGNAGQAKAGASMLFGAGIKPPGSGGAKQAGADSGEAQREARPGASGATPRDQVAPVPAIVLRAARSQSSSNGDGSILALLGGGVAIIILGALGGTLMRRGRRSLPSA
jgi:hypothetical protein